MSAVNEESLNELFAVELQQDNKVQAYIAALKDRKQRTLEAKALKWNFSSLLIISSQNNIECRERTQAPACPPDHRNFRNADHEKHVTEETLSKPFAQERLVETHDSILPL